MPDRFPAAIEQSLVEGGWSPEPLDENLLNQTIAYIERQVGRDGAAVQSFPAAVDVLREFGGVCVIQDGPGTDFRLRSFMVDPTRVAATTECLTSFGEIIDTKLFPLGMEGDHESIIAIAENGHVFALDHAGEWHLGDSMDDAIVTLVTGTAPQRVDAHGNW